MQLYTASCSKRLANADKYLQLQVGIQETVCRVDALYIVGLLDSTSIIYVRPQLALCMRLLGPVYLLNFCTKVLT